LSIFKLLINIKFFSRLNRLYIFSLLCLSILTFTSCVKDDNVGAMTINFKLKYGSKDLVMLQKYDYPVAGYPLAFNRFSFFISEVTLNSTGGNSEVEDIAYLDLTNSHSTAAGAAVGYNFEIKNIKPGSYTGMTFALGVPALSNSKIPANFNEKPLSDQAEYWGDWKSYIFTRTEGQIDFDKDGKLESSFALHTGANIAFRTLRITAPIEITETSPGKINIEIDLQKQFSGSKIYDIKTNPQIHSLNQGGLVVELVDNLVKAFKLN
jgi:hypothetical protein